MKLRVNRDKQRDRHLRSRDVAFTDPDLEPGSGPFDPRVDLNLQGFDFASKDKQWLKEMRFLGRFDKRFAAAYREKFDAKVEMKLVWDLIADPMIMSRERFMQAMDMVQIYPEIRNMSVKEKTFNQHSLEFFRLFKSLSGVLEDPFYVQMSLESTPEAKEEIMEAVKILRGRELLLEILDMPVDIEGQLEDLSIYTLVFPDLADRIKQKIAPYWSEIRKKIFNRGTGQPLHLDRHVLALTILGAERAWIDEQGQFQIELPHSPIQNPKPLPQRATL